MDTQVEKMESKTESQTVRRLAPEDVRKGQFVTVHRRIGEVFWLANACESAFVEPSVKVLRYGYTPNQSGLPLRVKEVCLPFVLVNSPQGRVVTLDTRSVEMVELSESYGKAAFKALRQNHKKNSTPVK